MSKIKVEFREESDDNNKPKNEIKFETNLPLNLNYHQIIDCVAAKNGFAKKDHIYLK